MHGYGCLVVVRGREDLRFLGRNRGVLLDQRRHHSTHGFNTQGQGCYVQQQYVFYISGQYRSLDGSTHGYRFIRVYILAGFLAEEIFYLLLNQRHTGLTAHKNYFIDIGRFQTGILQCGFAGLQGIFHHFLNQRFQLGAGQLDVQVFRAGSIRRDVRQVHFSLLAGRQLDLGFLCGFFQALQGQRIVVQIDAGILLEGIR